MQRSIFSFAIILWVQLYMLGPEMMKLPMLWQHFQEHRSEEGDLAFNTFLEEHYEHEEHEGDCDPDHERLPYHHHGQDCCASIVFPPQSNDQFKSADPASLSIQALTDEDDELQGHSRGLIMPPRYTA